MHGRKCIASSPRPPPVASCLVSLLCSQQGPSGGQTAGLAPFVPAAQWQQGCSLGIRGDVGERGLRFHLSASSPFLLSFPPLNLGVQCCWEKRVGDLALKEMNPRTEQDRIYISYNYISIYNLYIYRSYNRSSSSYIFLVTENKFLLFLDGTSREHKMLEALKCYLLSANSIKNVALKFQILGTWPWGFTINKHFYFPALWVFNDFSSQMQRLEINYLGERWLFLIIMISCLCLLRHPVL